MNEEIYLNADLEEIQDAANLIECAFVWKWTDEGYDYWCDVYRNLRNLANRVECFQKKLMSKQKGEKWEK